MAILLFLCSNKLSNYICYNNSLSRIAEKPLDGKDIYPLQTMGCSFRLSLGRPIMEVHLCSMHGLVDGLESHKQVQGIYEFV